MRRRTKLVMKLVRSSPGSRARYAIVDGLAAFALVTLRSAVHPSTFKNERRSIMRLLHATAVEEATNSRPFKRQIVIGFPRTYGSTGNRGVVVFRTFVYLQKLRANCPPPLLYRSAGMRVLMAYRGVGDHTFLGMGRSRRPDRPQRAVCPKVKAGERTKKR